jgi:hypothetical protein
MNVAAIEGSPTQANVDRDLVSLICDRLFSHPSGNLICSAFSRDRLLLVSGLLDLIY